jgi:phosphomannomutase/phosphoglucomutase
MDTRDGVKVIMPDGWLLVRGSNTEPIVRVVAEAKNEERARELVQDMIDKIRI